MSKKHYQALARAIFETRDSVPAFSQSTDVRACGVWTKNTPHNELVERIADVLAADNPRFDRGRFLEACETGACKGMPKRERAA
jgi:hypothetical protein